MSFRRFGSRRSVLRGVRVSWRETSHCWMTHFGNRIQVDTSCIIFGVKRGLILVYHGVNRLLERRAVFNTSAICYTLRCVKMFMRIFVALLNLIYRHIRCLWPCRDRILLINWAAVGASIAFKMRLFRDCLLFGVHIYIFGWGVHAASMAWVFSLQRSNSSIEEEILATHHTGFRSVRCKCALRCRGMHTLGNRHRAMVIEEVVLCLCDD